MVCLVGLGRRTEKTGTTPDLPDRPNRLTETKSSHIDFLFAGMTVYSAGEMHLSLKVLA